METHVVTASARGTAARAAESLVRDLERGLDGREAALIMVFASTEQPLGEVAAILTGAFPKSTVLGASTAGEFTERGDTKGAVCAVAIAGELKVYAGIGAGVRASPERAVAQALEGLPRAIAGYPYRTGLLLIDTMAGNCEEVTLIAAAELGADEPLAGGAAGDDLKMESTIVSCGGRAASDAVVIGQIFSKAPIGVGVCHGHRPLSQPLKVTKAKGNVVEEIEGRPAWEVWRERTRDAAMEQGLDVDALATSEETSFLLRFEAGLAAGQEYKIRAPLARSEGGAIDFACGVPEGAVIRITESTPRDQIVSAREAARRAKAKLGGRPPAGAIVFDCICRNLILRDEFGAAVKGMVEELGNVPLAGFETYGEIALDAGDMSGFHNTTSVVLVFPR
ncbi:MAG: FIST C-terminal domain-containing protein [Deltaproteobacteria bacterium]|nr:FIST C-terminal domain-containing protein [Deltaproteobacteria bacterium]